MAATLTATPVRKAHSTLARYTGLPKIPQNIAVALPADVVPSSRLVRRASKPSSTTVVPTWFAQPNTDGVTGTMACLTSVEGTAVRGIVCDPTLVDWATVTRTYQRPRNPTGGLARWNKTIGTASFKDGGTVLDSEAAIEEWQPLLSGLNTLVTAKKLPPISVTIGTPTSTFPLGIYAFGGVGLVKPTYPGAPFVFPEAKALRWLGFQLGVNITIPPPTGGANIDCDVYVVPINSGTLIGDVAAKFKLATISAVRGATTSQIFTAAELTTAGLVRWDQFWVYATSANPAAVLLAASAGYVLYSPLDIPPPYDCPGLEGFIPGGYYA